MSLRKITRNCGSFPNDEVTTKLFYLAIRNVSKKWTMPIQVWKPALDRFIMQFECECSSINRKPVYTKFWTPSACNPPLVHRPATPIRLSACCRRATWWCCEQPDRKIIVGFMGPIAVLKLTDNSAITQLAGEVSAKLERVRDKLSRS